METDFSNRYRYEQYSYSILSGYDTAGILWDRASSIGLQPPFIKEGVRGQGHQEAQLLCSRNRKADTQTLTYSTHSMTHWHIAVDYSFIWQAYNSYKFCEPLPYVLHTNPNMPLSYFGNTTFKFNNSFFRNSLSRSKLLNAPWAIVITVCYVKKTKKKKRSILCWYTRLFKWLIALIFFSLFGGKRQNICFQMKQVPFSGSEMVLL